MSFCEKKFIYNIFIYNELTLDANEAFKNNESQLYAHKNSNPIVGRAVKGELGIYECGSNIGSWNEYYSQYINSISLVFDMRDDETDGQIILNKSYASGYLGLDLDNTWVFEEVKTGDIVTGYKLYLK